MVVLSNASVANAVRMKNVLEFKFLLAGGKHSANIVHYVSTRCQSGSRLLMAAEVHVLVHPFDYGFNICQALHVLLGIHVELE